MPESFVGVTQGSGTKLHTFQRTIGVNVVEDEFTVPGEYPLPTYAVVAPSVSIGTVNDHALQIMAGAAVYVRIRRIRVEQAALATTANTVTFSVIRLSTAGTGGTAITPVPFDTGEAAASATAMTLPTAKGTEGGELVRRRFFSVQTAPVGGLVGVPHWEWVQLPGEKPIIISSGVTNGIAIKVVGAAAGATADISVEFIQTTFPN